MIVCGNNFSAIELLFLSIAAAIGNRHDTDRARILSPAVSIPNNFDEELPHFKMRLEKVEWYEDFI